jgi:hypothetical protein
MGDGFEMRTAAVTVPGESAKFYEGWLYGSFSEVDLFDPALEAEVWGEHADPDEDGLSNLMEYFTARDPRRADSTAVLGAPQIAGEEIFVEFRQSLSAIGVVGQVEWSADLLNWSRLGVEQEPIGEDSGHVVMRASRSIGEARKAYFRLTVQRAP